MGTAPARSALAVQRARASYGDNKVCSAASDSYHNVHSMKNDGVRTQQLLELGSAARRPGISPSRGLQLVAEGPPRLSGRTVQGRRLVLASEIARLRSARASARERPTRLLVAEESE